MKAGPAVEREQRRPAADRRGGAYQLHWLLAKRAETGVELHQQQLGHCRASDRSVVPWPVGFAARALSLRFMGNLGTPDADQRRPQLLMSFKILRSYAAVVNPD